MFADIKRRHRSVEWVLVFDIPVVPLKLPIQDIDPARLFPIAVSFTRILNESHGRMVVHFEPSVEFEAL